MSLKGIISIGPWGGQGGDRWSFKARNGIAEILIHHKDNIRSISFKDSNGNISGTFGDKDPNVRGDLTKIEIHGHLEYLISISGTYGDYNGLLVIKSLSFHTNLKNHGPFGTTSNEDTPFSVPISDDVVVGFHGTSGYYLDSIGLFLRPVASHNNNGTISFGPWGGEGGGGPFSFRVRQGSWIKQIILQHGRTINSISFTDDNGHFYGKFGGEDPNDLGVETVVDINGPSEYLTSISGTYGQYKGLKVITSLLFITNLTIKGPFGVEDYPDSFSIPIQSSHVVGFHGRAGYFLDSIGIFVKPAIIT